MENEATPIFTVDWRPGGRGGADLTLSLELPDRDAVLRLVGGPHAPAVVRVTDVSGASTVASAASVMRWPDAAPLPQTDVEWRVEPRRREDGAQAVDMLEAFLAWTRSRGLLDEASSARISRAVQMEMAGEAPDTPR